MNDKLSLTIFTIEVDGKPVLAFGSKKYSEAETFCGDERIRAKLSSVASGGKPVCDDLAILHVRIARPHEKALYYEQASSHSTEGPVTVVYLVELDPKT